jgi:hypothetical protein
MKRRVLHNLKINEVSSVDRGAGEGVQIVMRKSYGTREHLRQLFETIDFNKVRQNFITKRDDDDIEDNLDVDEEEIEDRNDDVDRQDELPPGLTASINAVMAASPGVTQEQAANWLVHTARGRSTHQALSKQRKASPMKADRATELRSIAKDFGVVQLAKHLVADNASHGITEAELTGLIDIEAQRTRKAGERSATAFARYFQSDEALPLRKAIAVCKAMMPTEPLVTGVGNTSIKDDSAKAIAQLTQMAEAMRAASPEMKLSDALTSVYTDPANVVLVKQAHVRPSPTTSYAFPV